MRSTRATAAVARLNARSTGEHYSMVRTASEHFYLVRQTETGTTEPLGPPLELDAFVQMVNKTGPQIPQRVSKLDVAFERQLGKRS
jgi:hypothetical protein